MIRHELQGNALCIEFQDEARRNALANADYEALAALLENPKDARCVVFEAAGLTFCAGNRLDRFEHEWPQPPKGPVARFLNALSSLRIPAIAVVQGGAVGIGATMLLHCDLVLCSSEAFVVYPFVPLGIAPEGGASWYLPRILGRQRAMEILLSGRKVSADEMLGLGLCSFVYDPSGLDAAKREWVERIRKLDRASVAETKGLMRQCQPLNASELFEREIHSINLLLARRRTNQVNSRIPPDPKILPG